MSGWGKVAGVGLQLFAAGLEAKAQFTADLENAKTQQVQRRIAFNRDTEAFLNNMSVLKKQKTADSLNLAMASQKVQDELTMGMAGSGFTGQSVSELEADMTRSFAQDQLAIDRAAEGTADAAKAGLRVRNENRVMEANMAKTTDYTKGIQSALLSSVGSALAMQEVLWV